MEKVALRRLKAAPSMMVLLLNVQPLLELEANVTIKMAVLIESAMMLKVHRVIQIVPSI